MKIEEIKKVYWTIAQVSEMISVNASTLRFWESEFDWLNPKRNRKGERKYKVADIEDVKSIKLLIKGLGMTLDGVRKAYAMGYNKDLELIIENSSIPVVSDSVCDGSTWKTCETFKPLEWGCEECPKYKYLKQTNR